MLYTAEIRMEYIVENASQVCFFIYQESIPRRTVIIILDFWVAWKQLDEVMFSILILRSFTTNTVNFHSFSSAWNANRIPFNLCLDVSSTNAFQLQITANAESLRGDFTCLFIYFNIYFNLF